MYRFEIVTTKVQQIEKKKNTHAIVTSVVSIEFQEICQMRTW